MHVLDFAVFMRFATMNDDAEGAANVLNATKNLTDRTRANAMLRVAADVRRQTREKLTRYRAAGTRLGRDVARNREADALIEALQEEVAVYVSHRDPAVGDVERELEFRVELVMPVGIAADAAGDAVGSRCRLVPRLTPAPTIALPLDADVEGAGASAERAYVYHQRGSDAAEYVEEVLAEAVGDALNAAGDDDDDDAAGDGGGGGGDDDDEIVVPKVHVFNGHARWSRSQLMNEVARGDWGLCPATRRDLGAGWRVAGNAFWSTLFDSGRPIFAKVGE